MSSQAHRQNQYRTPARPCSDEGTRGRATPRGIVKLLALALVPALQACKVEVEVPKGGRVVTESGSFVCKASETCEIDVVDTFFEETFVAQPNPGWMFRRWEEVPSGFCGNKIGPCPLSTAGFENSENLMSVLESDRVFYLKPVFERIPKIKEENLEASGKVVNLPDGIEVDGELKLKTGNGPVRMFEDARLAMDAGRPQADLPS